MEIPLVSGGGDRKEWRTYQTSRVEKTLGFRSRGLRGNKELFRAAELGKLYGLRSREKRRTENNGKSERKRNRRGKL
jgi:hypothetical protein